MRRLGAHLALLLLPACNQLLGVANPTAGDATATDGPRPDGPMDDAALDAPPACTTALALGAEITSTTGGTGVALDTGRLNAGLTEDVVVSLTTDTAILAGNGDGTFGAPANLGTASIAVIVDDLNQASIRDDLLLISPTSVVVKRQDEAGAAGTFLADQPLDGTFAGAERAGAGRIDGNGNNDLIVGDDSGVTSFTDLNAAGTFSRENTVGIGNRLVIAQDIDRDGRADALIVAADGTVKLVLGTSTGQLLAPTTVAMNATGLGIGVGKFDGDNFLDIMVATADGGIVYLQNSASPGVFTKQTGTFGGIKSTVPLVVGDVNGDGLDDIITPTTVTMQCPTTRVFTQVESINGANAVLADVTGDTKLDLLRLSGTDLIVRVQQ